MAENRSSGKKAGAPFVILEHTQGRVARNQAGSSKRRVGTAPTLGQGRVFYYISSTRLQPGTSSLAESPRISVWHVRNCGEGRKQRSSFPVWSLFLPRQALIYGSGQAMTHEHYMSVFMSTRKWMQGYPSRINLASWTADAQGAHVLRVRYHRFAAHSRPCLSPFHGSPSDKCYRVEIM